ncbi:MAG: SDR family oxidoreductase [Anaerolineales bacterium]
MPKNNIFLTGATGSLGYALLPELLRRSENNHVYCLVRPNPIHSAEERLRMMVKTISLNAHESGRIHCVPGDATLPGLGIEKFTFSTLSSQIDQVFHLAASVDFMLDLEESRRQNVGATTNVLEFCKKITDHKRGNFRLNHVSTAYVCGRKSGHLSEGATAGEAGYFNSYEQSKAEAEEVVRNAATQIPTTIYRPSQIIGDSNTGCVHKFFGFYEFVAMGARGRSDVLVANGNTRPDMVPSDFVAKAMLFLGEQTDTIGQTYHLAAGLANSLTVNQVVERVTCILRDFTKDFEKFKQPRVISSDSLETTLTAEELKAFAYSPQKLLLRSYAPYLTHEKDFDVNATQRRLEHAGIRLPPMSTVIDKTTAYALSHRNNKMSTVTH